MDNDTRTNNKGFTLIELIVVMAIIAILVLLAAPRFLGYTKDANVAAMQQDIKVLSDAAEIYYVKENEWPVLEDESGHIIGDIEIPGLNNEELYPLDKDKLSGNISSIKDDFTDYGIVTTGRHEGTVFSIKGTKNKDGVIIHTNKKYEGNKSKGIPGPSKLIAGNYTEGFFGEVPVNELFTGDEIAELAGITEGQSMFSNEPWLKFSLDGKILFKSKKPYRRSLSWNHINEAGAVYGDKIITKNGLKYKVRLLRGQKDNNSQFGVIDRGAIGSEWNRLILPIHNNAQSDNWNYPKYAGENIPDWTPNINDGKGYSDEDLYAHWKLGLGSSQWTQDTPSDHDGVRINRSGIGVSHIFWDAPHDSAPRFGWSPVLELIE